MKSLFYTFILLLAFASCSKDKSNENEQGYTSFVINSNDDFASNCIAVYYSEGKCIKIADIGNLGKGKQSVEVRINNDTIKNIYILSSEVNKQAIKADTVFTLKKNEKNIFTLNEFTSRISVDCYQDHEYPIVHPYQDTTSFILYTYSPSRSGVLSGYYLPNGKCKKLSFIDIVSRPSETYPIETMEGTKVGDSISHIYIFEGRSKFYKFDTVYILTKNQKNYFKLDWNNLVEVDPNNENEYPH